MSTCPNFAPLHIALFAVLSCLFLAISLAISLSNYSIWQEHRNYSKCIDMRVPISTCELQIRTMSVSVSSGGNVGKTYDVPLFLPVYHTVYTINGTTYQAPFCPQIHDGYRSFKAAYESILLAAPHTEIIAKGYYTVYVDYDDVVFLLKTNFGNDAVSDAGDSIMIKVDPRQPAKTVVTPRSYDMGALIITLLFTIIFYAILFFPPNIQTRTRMLIGIGIILMAPPLHLFLNAVLNKLPKEKLKYSFELTGTLNASQIKYLIDPEIISELKNDDIHIAE